MASSNPVDLAGSEGGEGKAHALKPLEELTDADIRQLTREDCRRYLKERGMRRPSWNKAQAIQQVLSLRSLMCSSTKPASSKPDANVQGEAGDVPPTKQLLDKVVSHHQSSSTANNPSDPPAGSSGAPGAEHSFLTKASNTPVAPRPTIQKPHRAQLTIFYSGVVKVYEDIPLEKAQAIMLLAASKTFQTNPTLLSSSTTPPRAQAQQQAYPHPPPPPFSAGAAAHPTAPLHNSHHEEGTDSDAGLPQARTVSLQRFLAKRRERISANPSFYRRCDKQPGSKRSKPSSSSSSSPPPAAFPPVAPRRTPSPVLSSTKKKNNNNSHNHMIIINSPGRNNIDNNKSDLSSASSSDNTTSSTTAANTSKTNYIATARRSLVEGTF